MVAKDSKVDRILLSKVLLDARMDPKLRAPQHSKKVAY